MRKRWLAWLCGLLLLCSAASAEITAARQSFDGRAMQLDVQAKALSRMPYDEERTGWVNDLLKHVTLSLRFRDGGSVDWTEMQLLVDDQKAVVFSRYRDEKGDQLQTSLEPDVTYTAGKHAVELLLGTEAPSDSLSLMGITADHLAVAGDAEQLVHAMSSDWADRIRSQKGRHAVEGFGTAVRRKELTVTGDTTDVLRSWVLEHSGNGILRYWLEQLSFTGGQSFTWYLDGHDQCVQFVYTGNIMDPDGGKRHVTVTWNMVRSDTEQKDQLTVRMPLYGETRTVPANSLTWSQEKKDGKTSASFTYALARGKKKQTMCAQLSLESIPAGDDIQYVGTASVERDVTDEEPQKLDMKLDMTVRADGLHATGTLETAQTVDRKNLEAAILSFTLKPCDYPMWQMRSQTVQLDRLDDKALVAMSKTLLRRAERAIVRPLVLLPAEDTLFFSKDLSAADWAEIVNAARRGN